MLINVQQGIGNLSFPITIKDTTILQTGVPGEDYRCAART
jgi:hypothetical protein